MQDILCKASLVTEVLTELGDSVAWHKDRWGTTVLQQNVSVGPVSSGFKTHCRIKTCHERSSPHHSVPKLGRATEQSSATPLARAAAPWPTRGCALCAGWRWTLPSSRRWHSTRTSSFPRPPRVRTCGVLAICPPLPLQPHGLPLFLCLCLLPAWLIASMADWASSPHFC